MTNYWLTDRFAGGMVGAVLGECMGTWSNLHPPVTLRSLEQLAWMKPEPTPVTLNWSVELVAGVMTLLEPIAIDLEQLPALIDPTLPIANRAIASLPLAFYLHNDPQWLQHCLEASLTSTPCSKTEQATIALLVDVVAAILRGDDPMQSIHWAIDDAELANQCPALIYRLTQLYDLLTQKLGLTAAVQLSEEDDLPQLSRANSINRDTIGLVNAVTIALYGFLSSPDQFRLAIVRVAILGYAPSLTCTLVGILSGIYNTMADIPLAWQRCLRQTEGCVELTANPSCYLARLSKQFTAVWSGVYSFDIETPLLPVVIPIPQPRRRL